MGDFNWSPCRAALVEIQSNISISSKSANQQPSHTSTPENSFPQLWPFRFDATRRDDDARSRAGARLSLARRAALQRSDDLRLLCSSVALGPPKAKVANECEWLGTRKLITKRGGVQSKWQSDELSSHLFDDHHTHTHTRSLTVLIKNANTHAHKNKNKPFPREANYLLNGCTLSTLWMSMWQLARGAWTKVLRHLREVEKKKSKIGQAYWGHLQEVKNDEFADFGQTCLKKVDKSIETQQVTGNMVFGDKSIGTPIRGEENEDFGQKNRDTCWISKVSRKVLGKG